MKVGITGGIGSGKTTVSRYFEILGIPVFNSDRVSSDILNTNKDVHLALTEMFGSVVLRDGFPDRKFIASKAFSNPDLLYQLNQLIHPIVKVHFENWCNLHIHLPYVLKEAAILFETGSYKELDKTILVTCPIALRKQRTMKRSGISEAEFIKRMSNQWTDKQKRKIAGFEIINDEKHSIILQVQNIHNQILHDSDIKQSATKSC
ncbi:MAG: dephospho-CoA kinase [Flavobacteriales bacterium]